MVSTEKETDDQRDTMSEGVNITKLREAVQESYRRIKVFRDNRLEYLKEYAGPEYGEHASPASNMVNNIHQYVNVVSRLLTPGNPQVTIDTFHKNLLPDSKSLEHALNNRIKQIKLGKVVERAVVESQFSLGVIKVGLESAGTTEVNGEEIELTNPFAESIEFSDFVWDLESSTYEACQFVGDRFTKTIQEIEDEGIFDDDAIAKIKESISRDDTDSDELPTHSMVSGERYQDRFQETIFLWNIWLPHERRLIVMLDDDPEDGVLLNNEYIGPDHGPYTLYSVNDVPGNVMPASPVSILYKLHKLSNRLFAKTANQADRQKTIVTVQKGGDKDAEAMTQTPDGETTSVKNPKQIQEVRFGGADQATVGFNAIVDDKFNKSAGNMELMGGIDSQADTLGQEKLLSGQNSTQLRKQADRVEEATTQVIQDLAFYLYDDPIQRFPIRKEVTGLRDTPIYSEFGPENRTADFVNFMVDIQPYSLNDQTPQEQVNHVISIMTSLYLPLQEQFAQQGMALNLSEMAAFIADRSNMPIFSRILTMQDGTPVTNNDKPSSDRPLQAAKTERTHIRRNEGGGKKPSPVEQFMNIQTPTTTGNS